jgi:uncharacterized protein
MRGRLLRYAPLLPLVALACAACSNAGTLATRVFTDPVAAQIAEAAAANNAARIRKLIEGGADPNAIGDKGTSLLQWALLNRSKAGMEALLNAGADPRHADEAGDTVMQYAAKANDPEYLGILLAHQVDPNMPNAVTGATPIMAALMGDRDEQFHALLATGADPSLTDRGGNTSLHVAAKISHYGLVLELLEAHTDPTVRNKQGVTFLRYLNMTPTNLLNDDARRQRESTIAWLRDHDVVLEDPPAR